MAVCLSSSHGVSPCFHELPSERRVRWFLIDRDLDSDMSKEQLFAADQSMRRDMYEDLDEIYDEAERGDLEAQLQLGIMHYYGWGTESCNAEALDWFEKAAKRNEEAKLLFFAIEYKEGYRGKPNPKEALRYFLIAAQQGNPFAARQAAEILYSGWEVERNEEEAVSWFEKAAEQGDIEAHYLSRAIRLKSGLGVEQSDAEAQAFFLKAASLRNSLAELEMGESCFNFERREWRDSSVAVQWFERAYRHGNSAARFLLEGLRCYKDLHSFSSQRRAFERFTKAAQGGNLFAQYILGGYHENGVGTEVNFASALFWYMKAAKRGSIHAQLKVACFFDQIGFSPNPEQAFHWYSQAAISKHPRALCYLAKMYRRGRGVKQNPGMACELYRMAALKGDKQAKNILSQWNL